MQGWDDEEDEGGDYEDFVEEGEGWVDEDEEGGLQEDGNEKVEVLSEFEVERINYALVRIMEPVFFIAKEAGDSTPGEMVLLGESEGKAVAPAVEAAIAKRGEGGRLGLVM